ncbi:hypothetical protein [Paractinoplanes globisporus]|uniref:Uncharacterized protein n=1 Tax=Paractinoplanes globisporus TaxID=113565 RepID=A0ABW6WW14_9ACTN|nr:hypothetical protein [Actinoplanes globisporus]
MLTTAVKRPSTLRPRQILLHRFSSTRSLQAVVVARALQRERRRAAAERDAAIYAAEADGHDDLDDLAGWAGSQPIDLD